MIRIYQIAVVFLRVTASAASRHAERADMDLVRTVPVHAEPALVGSQPAIPVRGIVIDGVQVLLDSTQTLLNVQEVLGKSGLTRPRHHDDFWSICYTVATANGSAELRLLSNEIGGPAHTILGFELKEVRAQRRSDVIDCPAVPRGTNGAITDNGLWLGMSVSDLLQRMGTPVRKSKSLYEFESRRAVSGRGAAQAYDITGSLRAEALRNRVTKLWAWYVKTT